MALCLSSGLVSSGYSQIDRGMATLLLNLCGTQHSYRVVVAELEKETLEVGDRLLQESLVEYEAYAAPPEFEDPA